MCLQCDASAENLGLVLPGWFLMRSTKPHEDWPEGHWGLVRKNDPDFVWETRPTPDPLHGVPESEWEVWLKANPAGTPDYVRTMEEVPEDFRKALECPPDLGWEIVQTAIPFGYDPMTSGWFSDWLFSWIGIRMRDGFLPAPAPTIRQGEESPHD